MNHNAKRAADYLRALATMIERGSVQAFHLAWAAREDAAPEGTVAMDAQAIQIQQPTIQVIDFTKSDLPS
jgi:hypothetical protein